MGNRVQGVWVTWAMRPTGAKGYRGMGHMGNRVHGQWGTWVMGHIGIIVQRSRRGTGVMGHMGISSLILQGSFSSFDSVYIWIYSI